MIGENKFVTNCDKNDSREYDFNKKCIWCELILTDRVQMVDDRRVARRDKSLRIFTTPLADVQIQILTTLSLKKLAYFCYTGT